MASPVLKFLALSSLVALAFLVLAQPATAQQITYYSFDNASSVGFGCVDPAVDPEGAASNSLLCFNGYYPQIYNDYYPPNVDPSGTGSYHNALYLHNYYSYNESAWFSVPQDITEGFTTYFAFRITPSFGAPPADGFAFVVQNATGGQGPETFSGLNCQEGSTGGPTALGGPGGCMGYGGIDASFAVEFDTYTNPFDPGYAGNNFISANHIAFQNCFVNPNSPNHDVTSEGAGCLVDDDGINNSLSVSISDGQVHEVVLQYDGDSSGEIWLYLDPPFIPGTHTPCPDNTTPGCPVAASYVIWCPLQVGWRIGLNSPGGKAYVGFTGATENSLAETTDILAWTFTPHTTASQQQPINSGTPTTFPFGQHTYTVTYPPDVNVSNIDMVVDANPISPTDFATLVTGGPFDGSTCQTYEGTGTAGNPNCIVYSVHCVTHGTSSKVACPSTSDPIIPVKTAYESNPNLTPSSPGFLQGDPFFTQIASIQGNGNMATVTCTGECSVTNGQSITIGNNAEAGFNGTFTVSSVLAIDSFTFDSPDSNGGNGGYITSSNVRDICNLSTDNPPCWQPNRIDGTSAGKTKNFSDFVALFQTSGPPSITSPSSASFPTGSASSFTVTTAGFPVAALSTTSPLDGLTFTDNGDGTGTLSGTPTNSGTFTIVFKASNGHSPDATQSFMLTVTQATVQITVNTSPSGRSFTVDSTTYNSSQTFTWNVGDTSHTISTTTPQAGGTGTQYAWSSWSDSGAISHGITVPASATTYTAYFNTQYQLTTGVAPADAGTISPVSGTYYNANTSASLSAAANAGYTFSSFSSNTGTVTNPNMNPGASILMSGPESVTANFTSTGTGPLSANPNTLAFGYVDLGSSKSMSLTVKNTGSSSLNITKIYFNYGPGSGKDYGYTTQCGGTLKAGKSCSITVTLKAQDLGSGSAQLLIAYNQAGSPAVVNLSGTVINPKAKLSVSSLSFGTVKVGQNSTKAVTLTSIGDTPLVIDSITISGSSDFTQTNTCPIGGTGLNAPQSCTITVKFAPSAKTSRSGTLKISDNASSSPQTVSLSGKGN